MVDFEFAVNALLTELALIPYENLSKIVASRHAGQADAGIEMTTAWLANPFRTGHGGTCFSLTYWLKVKLNALGINSVYLMGDKRQEKNVHCALMLEMNQQTWLLDPGYLIYIPLAIPETGQVSVQMASPLGIRLECIENVYRLWTGPITDLAALKHRFDFRREPVSENEFIKHWAASYRWPMMNYPVLNQLKDGQQFYLQKNSLLIRNIQGSRMRSLTRAEWVSTAESVFGLQPALVQEALECFGAAADLWWAKPK